jgi:hypothetical protein
MVHDAQRASASISACMRSLNSSDQWAPGFSLLLCFGCDGAGGLLCLGELRAPDLSLRVPRDDAGECESELFMQSVYYPISVCWPIANVSHSIEGGVVRKELSAAPWLRPQVSAMRSWSKYREGPSNGASTLGI